MPSSLLSFQVDKNDLARVERNLERVSGKSLFVKMQRANLTVGDIISRRARAASPRITGNLRSSIRARPIRVRGFAGLGSYPTTGVLVGPTYPKGSHRSLVIRGHNIVTPGGRSLGRRTRANPFVDRASSGIGPQAAEIVKREWFG
jgi:hypothetical protein